MSFENYILMVFLPSIVLAVFVVMFVDNCRRIKEIHENLFPEQYPPTQATEDRQQKKDRKEQKL